MPQDNTANHPYRNQHCSEAFQKGPICKPDESLTAGQSCYHVQGQLESNNRLIPTGNRITLDDNGISKHPAPAGAVFRGVFCHDALEAEFNLADAAGIDSPAGVGFLVDIEFREMRACVGCLFSKW